VLPAALLIAVDDHGDAGEGAELHVERACYIIERGARMD
jgi:hypothetical protein